jgi:hypothetical protein
MSDGITLHVDSAGNGLAILWLPGGPPTGMRYFRRFY